MYPSTGGMSGPKNSLAKMNHQNMKHTKVPGLVPVNISSQFELYLGIKNHDGQSESLIYNGDRLQFNRQESEFEVISGN